MTFLHEQPDFGDLLAVVGDALKIDPGLVEKDYWLMHTLWGLQQLAGRRSVTSSRGSRKTLRACDPLS